MAIFINLQNSSRITATHAVVDEAHWYRKRGIVEARVLFYLDADAEVQGFDPVWSRLMVFEIAAIEAATGQELNITGMLEPMILAALTTPPAEPVAPAEPAA